ncbi:MAG: Gfo/Idh/MocA family protein [Candidatus Tectimicrobiota bacterium]
MAEADIRVGLIGAGGNVRNRHLPGFRKVAGVEIVGVVNRSRASSHTFAEEFNIPRIYDTWQELLADESVTAVCIGTWPYMHRTMTIEALERGKHVLTEARMASTAQEARDMLAASRRYPHLVCQLTPTSTTYKIDRVLQRLIGEGFLGELLSVEIQALQNRFVDRGGPLHWRHDWAMSGYNTLNIGASYESMMRWVGRGTRVMAMAKTHVPYRRNAQGALTSVHIPDHIDILYELVNGAQVHMRMSASTGLSTGNQIWFYGTEGTIYVDQKQTVFAGRRGDTQLTEVPNPPQEQASYRVEEGLPMRFAVPRRLPWCPLKAACIIWSGPKR